MNVRPQLRSRSFAPVTRPADPLDAWELDPMLDEPTLPPHRVEPEQAAPVRRRRRTSMAVKHWLRPTLGAAAVAFGVLALVGVGLTGLQASQAAQVTELTDRALVEQALRGADAIRMLSPLGVATPAGHDARVASLLEGSVSEQRAAAAEIVAGLEGAVDTVVASSSDRVLVAAEARLESLQTAHQRSLQARQTLDAARSTPGGWVLDAVGAL